MKKFLVLIFLFLIPTSLQAMQHNDSSIIIKNANDALQSLNFSLDMCQKNEIIKDTRFKFHAILEKANRGVEWKAFWKAAHPKVHAISALESAKFKWQEATKFRIKEHCRIKSISNTAEDLSKIKELINIETDLYDEWINAQLNLITIEETENL